MFHKYRTLQLLVEKQLSCIANIYEKQGIPMIEITKIIRSNQFQCVNINLQYILCLKIIPVIIQIKQSCCKGIDEPEDLVTEIYPTAEFNRTMLAKEFQHRFLPMNYIPQTMNRKRMMSEIYQKENCPSATNTGSSTMTI